MKIYITAMSIAKEDIKKDILSIVDQLTYHLIKLYLFPSTQYTNHWRKEVWSFLNQVKKCKHNNKYPSSKWIYELVSCNLDRIQEMMEFIMDEYSELIPEQCDSEELGAVLDEYFKWLSEKLSAGRILRSAEVTEKLIELGL